MGGGIVDVLQFAIDGVTSEINSVGNNLANANTPNFVASDVSFEQSLAQAIDAPSTASASVSSAPSSAPSSTNGNDVNLASELVAAEKDALSYQQLSESLNAQFRLIAGSSGGSYT